MLLSYEQIIWLLSAHVASPQLYLQRYIVIQTDI
jgi:hypothetical protein